MSFLPDLRQIGIWGEPVDGKPIFRFGELTGAQYDELSRSFFKLCSSYSIFSAITKFKVIFLKFYMKEYVLNYEKPPPEVLERSEHCCYQ